MTGTTDSMDGAFTSGSDMGAAFLEQYKLAVEMADRVSARRATANAFFLSLLVGVGAVLGVAEPSFLLSVVGTVLALVWWVLLRSYRDLNRAKFNAITSMEAKLPAQPFDDEWQTLKKDPVKKWRPRYAELGTVERIVPWVFAALYITTGVAALID